MAPYLCSIKDIFLNNKTLRNFRMKILKSGSHLRNSMGLLKHQLYNSSIRDIIEWCDNE